MHGGDDSQTSLKAKILNQVHNFDLVIYVQVRCWLIKEDCLWLLCQSSGNYNPLPFSPRKFTHPAFGEKLSLRCPHRLPGDSHVLFSFVAQKPKMRCPPHQHNFKDSESPRQSRILWYCGHNSGKFISLDAFYITTTNEDVPGENTYHPSHSLDYG